ncbi:TPA: hypothetical protein ACP5VK_003682 [Vibrio parahaemolyticus]
MVIEIFNSNHTVSLNTLSPMRLLQLSRPTTKCKFVRYGDTVQLLVFLNDYSEFPFLRIPADALYNAVKRYVDHEKAIS